MNIEELVNQLKSQGLEVEQILQSLEQMVQEGQITAEDLEQAKALLSNNAQEQTSLEDEKKKASDLFGLKLM